MIYIIIIILLILGALASIFLVPKIANPTRIYVQACLAVGFLILFWFNNSKEIIGIKILITVVIVGSVIYDYFKWKKSVINKEHN